MTQQLWEDVAAAKMIFFFGGEEVISTGVEGAAPALQGFVTCAVPTGLRGTALVASVPPTHPGTEEPPKGSSQGVV